MANKVPAEKTYKRTTNALRDKCIEVQVEIGAIRLQSRQIMHDCYKFTRACMVDPNNPAKGMNKDFIRLCDEAELNTTDEFFKKNPFTNVMKLALGIEVNGHIQPNEGRTQVNKYMTIVTLALAHKTKEKDFPAWLNKMTFSAWIENAKKDEKWKLLLGKDEPDAPKPKPEPNQKPESEEDLLAKTENNLTEKWQSAVKDEAAITVDLNAAGIKPGRHTIAVDIDDEGGMRFIGFVNNDEDQVKHEILKLYKDPAPIKTKGFLFDFIQAAPREMLAPYKDLKAHKIYRIPKLEENIFHIQNNKDSWTLTCFYHFANIKLIKHGENVTTPDNGFYISGEEMNDFGKLANKFKKVADFGLDKNNLICKFKDGKTLEELLEELNAANMSKAEQDFLLGKRATDPHGTNDKGKGNLQTITLDLKAQTPKQKAKLIKTKLSEQGDEYKFQKLKPVVKFTDELSFRLSDSEGEKFVNAILAWRNNKQICLSFEKDKITTTMGEHVEKIPLTDTTGLDSKPLSAKYCPQDIMTALAICSRVKGRDDIVFQFYKELIQMSGVGPEYSYEIIVSSLNDNGIQKTNGFELKI